MQFVEHLFSTISAYFWLVIMVISYHCFYLHLRPFLLPFKIFLSMSFPQRGNSIGYIQCQFKQLCHEVFCISNFILTFIIKMLTNTVSASFCSLSKCNLDEHILVFSYETNITTQPKVQKVEKGKHTHNASIAVPHMMQQLRPWNIDVFESWLQHFEHSIYNSDVISSSLNEGNQSTLPNGRLEGWKDEVHLKHFKLRLSFFQFGFMITLTLCDDASYPLVRRCLRRKWRELLETYSHAFM